MTVLPIETVDLTPELLGHPEDCTCRFHSLYDPTYVPVPDAPPYEPPPILRVIARRWPTTDFLCEMPPAERALYVEGDRGEYHRQLLWLSLPDWAWEALRRGE